MWDWAYNHHLWLSAGIVAALVLAGSAWAMWRRRSAAIGLIAILAAAAPGIAIVGIAALWVLADQRSNDRDIATPVAAVAGALPAGAQQVGQHSGSNYRSRTYQVASGPTKTLAAIDAALARVSDAPSGTKIKIDGHCED